MAATVTVQPDGIMVVENSGLDGNGNPLPVQRFEIAADGTITYRIEASGGWGDYMTSRAGSNGWEYASHGSLPDGMKIPLDANGHLLLTED